ncbi:MAG: hypothetical protein K2N05_03240 [Muribaculaceae bacterium]|nr:hypothetical protein [Muribaculaceae bacterium]
MKRIISVLAILIGFWSFSFAFTLTQSDAKKENLKGKVKKVSYYSVEKQTYFHADTVAKYKRLKKPLPEYERSLRQRFEYNLQGMKTYSDDWYKEYYTFDPRNNRTLLFKTEKRYDSDGSVRRIYEQTFDEEWFPTSGKAVDGDGKLIFTETYDKKVRPDGKTELYGQHILADGSTTDIFILVRPDLTFERLVQKGLFFHQDIEMNGDEMPTRVYESRNGKVNKVQIEYGSDGRKVYTLDDTGNKTLITIVKNDANGNPICETEYNPDGGIKREVVIRYKYDSKGNWIRREVKKDSMSDPKITERDIEYYK